MRRLFKHRFSTVVVEECESDRTFEGGTTILEGQCLVDLGKGVFIPLTQEQVVALFRDLGRTLPDDPDPTTGEQSEGGSSPSQDTSEENKTDGQTEQSEVSDTQEDDTEALPF